MARPVGIRKPLAPRRSGRAFGLQKGTLTMKHFKMDFLLLVAAVVLLPSCSPPISRTNSGIPGKLDTEALIRAAGQPQGATVSRLGESGSSCSRYAMETERHFHVSVSSGTKGQLLAAYRASVRRAIESAGASINGTGLSGTEGDVQDFSYDYNWQWNAGIVKVYSFEGTNADIEIISLCYEHRR
jgi:hypothetical protein